MPTSPGTLTLWQSGRLAPSIRAAADPRLRERPWCVLLLALSALVLAIYVHVLHEEVDRSELAHAAQRSLALARARCELEQPGPSRGRCLAQLDGQAFAATLASDDGAGMDLLAGSSTPPLMLSMQH